MFLVYLVYSLLSLSLLLSSFFPIDIMPCGNRNYSDVCLIWLVNLSTKKRLCNLNDTLSFFDRILTTPFVSQNIIRAICVGAATVKVTAGPTGKYNHHQSQQQQQKHHKTIVLQYHSLSFCIQKKKGGNLNCSIRQRLIACSNVHKASILRQMLVSFSLELLPFFPDHLQKKGNHSFKILLFMITVDCEFTTLIYIKNQINVLRRWICHIYIMMAVASKIMVWCHNTHS